VRTLVTGGAGFIGSNLAAALVRDGHHVVVVDNLLSGHLVNLRDVDCEFVDGDIRDERLLARHMRGVDVVFHLAASVGNKRAIDHPVLDSEINVLGTVRVLEAARRAGVRKIVASSSAGIFGELKTLPIREDHQVEPDSPYGASKLCMEKQCLAYAKLYPLEAVCLRYFNVYGRHQRFDAYGNVIPIFVFQMLRGEPLTIFGDGNQTRDFVNVGDVVRANIQAATAAGVSGAFNIGSGSRITINNLVREISAAASVSPVVRRGPPRPGDVRDSLADISAARKAFGFEPSVGLRDGLPGYVDWARDELQRVAGTAA
jgi:nucleoside-diphosphate-sugar epimerase